MNYEQIYSLFQKAYDPRRWKQFLAEIFPKAQFLTQPQTLTDLDRDIASQVLKLGYIALEENGIERQIVVYQATLAPGVVLERNRVGLRNLLRKYWKEIDAAFITFHDSQSRKWRFTYVSELTGYDAEGNFQKIQTEPKRYTYVLGEGESVRTAAERFATLAQKGAQVSLDDIKEAFSVEKLSKAFFEEYKKHYHIFCNAIAQNAGLKAAIFNSDEKAIRDFVKKLLGRIVFLYFLQKKGWMGAPPGGPWGEGDINFLSRLFKEHPRPELFYSQTLAPLFFDTLNTQRQGDLIELQEGKPCRIPYLNGGLFEEEDPKQRNLVFNPKLFEDLFAFFNQYNFTIYEDDPNDHTVAVDPEMLGHIFENLLEDNKEKGAFYTPKEIVHYMCQETLIEYLAAYCLNSQDLDLTLTQEELKETIALFIKKKTFDSKDPQEPGKSKQVYKLWFKRLNQALDNVKICDPAIGSGAFPMGLLHEIFTAKQTLFCFEKQLDSQENPTRANWQAPDLFPASEVKRNIIQNSVYGVDIEKGAVDIARLRFWLSLVVDENEPKPLPNLDYKIVAGNSLVSKLGEDIIELDWSLDATKDGLFAAELAKRKSQLLQKISEKQKEFFQPQSDKKKLAAEIRNLKIDLLINQLELMIKNAQQQEPPKKQNYKDNKKFIAATELYYKNLGWQESLKQLKKLRTQPDKPLDFFDWRLDFPEIMNPALNPNPGFDIVIGNPPYIQLQKEGGKLAQMFEKQDYQTFERTGDIYSLFYEKGIQLLKNNGILAYITSNKWMRAAYGKNLRKYFCQHHPIKLIDLGSGVFDSATVDTNILIIQKTAQKPAAYALQALDMTKEKNLDPLNAFPTPWVWLTRLTEESWVIASDIERRIKAKIESKGKPLKHWDIHIYRGVLTGCNEAFIIDEKKKNELIAQDPKSAEILKPLLRGRDIKRYKAEWAGLWLIATHNGVKEKNIPRIDVEKDYPAVFKHLQQYEQKLIKRQDKGDHWTNLRNCAYIEEFEKEKIIFQEMVQFSSFFYNKNKKFFCLDTARIITGNDLIFLTSILNSKLFFFSVKNFYGGGGLGETGVRMKHTFFEKFKLEELSLTEQKPFIALVEQILAGKEKAEDTTALEKEIDRLVYALYGLTEEEIEVIEKG